MACELSRPRQVNFETGPAAFTRQTADGAAVMACNLPDEGKPKARPFARFPHCGRAVEGLKDSFPLPFRNSRSPVYNQNTGPI